MKTNPRPGRAGFTLIELMAVIAIIVLLAALVVGGMSFVMEKQNKEKAKVQMALLSKSLEEYKLDNGSYPATPDTSDGTKQTHILFNALFYNDGDASKKIYLPELDPGTTANPSKQGWTTPPAGANTIITDPWGNEYRYRTAVNASGAANSNTENPDFDLWSCGKDGQSTPATPGAKVNQDDIKSP